MIAVASAAGMTTAAAASAAPRPGLVVITGAPAPIAREVIQVARDLHVAVIDATPLVAPPTDPAPSLRAGITAYEALRFDEAVAALDRAVTAFGDSGGGELATSALSDVYLYRGLARRQLGQADAGWDDFVAAATIAPARVLDPARFPPRDVATFGLARDAVAQLATGELAVTGGDGCAIAIDGEPRRSATLPRGPHLVRAACAGQPGWGRMVTLAGAHAVVDVPAPPVADDASALIQARAAAVETFVIVGRTGAIVTLRLIASDGHTLERATAREPAEVGRALRALGAPAAAPVATPWYRKNWVWGVAGASLVAAIAVPLLVLDHSSTGGGVIQVQNLP